MVLEKVKAILSEQFDVEEDKSPRRRTSPTTSAPIRWMSWTF